MCRFFENRYRQAKVYKKWYKTWEFFFAYWWQIIVIGKNRHQFIIGKQKKIRIGIVICQDFGMGTHLISYKVSYALHKMAHSMNIVYYDIVEHSCDKRTKRKKNHQKYNRPRRLVLIGLTKKKKKNQYRTKIYFKMTFHISSVRPR